MTAESDIRDLGEMRAGAERALLLAKAHHAADLEDLEWWKDRANTAEQELRELHAEVAASTAIDLLGRYRRACIENATLTRKVAELESRAATAGAAAEALKGNR